jgi:chromosome partitioning protein
VAVDVIAVVSQKGGVGKTMTVANLGAALAQRGRRVVMVDFDPQADLSASWSLEEHDPQPRIERYLGRPDLHVSEALVEIPLDEPGQLALLPTAYEALRRQTARLLGGAQRKLADLLARPDGDFDR